MADYPLALVTGAAHRLGRAFALALARQGYAILLHYHQSRSDAAVTEEEICSVGVPVYPVQADLTSPHDLSALFSSLDSLPHKLNVLVNSAAIMPHKDFHTTSMADWDAALDLNLRAPFLLAQRAAECMGAGGLIVNVTDIGAQKNWTDYPAYVVSKSALETLTRLLAKAFAPGIRVNAIAPGLVLPSDNVTPEDWKKLIQRLPLQRPARVEDVTSALEFLIRNESVTGQTIVVDGGYSLL
jgi:pteridine reductase